MTVPQVNHFGPSSWTPFERRWLAILLAAAIPAGGTGRPGLGKVSLSAFWLQYEATAPPLLRLGLRSTVWLLTLSPIWYAKHACTFGRLDVDSRDRLLDRAARSNVFLIRQMLEALKLVACLAYFHDGEVRASWRSMPSAIDGVPIADSAEVGH